MNTHDTYESKREGRGSERIRSVEGSSSQIGLRKWGVEEEEGTSSQT